MISLVSLGCAKNQVDSERLLGALLAHGFLLAEDPARADICFVNTCGFIHDARAESAAALRDLAQLKRARGRPLVAALGCLVEKARQCAEFKPLLAMVDFQVGFTDYPRLPHLCRAWLGLGAQPAGQGGGCFHAGPRLPLGSPHSVYLKISEGCSNRCGYCSIPQIRGPQVSRPMAELVREARGLAALGAREINIIAQDITRYGADRHGRACLPRLLEKLLAVRGPAWWRLLYAHPAHLSDALLRCMAAEPRICRYLDVPLQHAAAPILRAMGRPDDPHRIRALLERITGRVPGVALRTTFIVGFPGETRAYFRETLALVREGWFTHVGVFAYSPEPGTPAAALPDRVPAREKELRRDELLRAQQKISAARLRALKGQALEVMIDRGPERGARPVAQGRTNWQAPDVDGIVQVTCLPAAPAPVPGDLVKVRITATSAYDLAGVAQA